MMMMMMMMMMMKRIKISMAINNVIASTPADIVNVRQVTSTLETQEARVTCSAGKKKSIVDDDGGQTNVTIMRRKQGAENANISMDRMLRPPASGDMPKNGNTKELSN